jgi:hypothetical protein
LLGWLSITGQLPAQGGADRPAGRPPRLPGQPAAAASDTPELRKAERRTETTRLEENSRVVFLLWL